MYEFYRTSLVGRSLLETIDNKIKTNAITPAQAHFILSKFDEVIPHVFSTSVSSNLSFGGKVLSYNFVDGVWQFIVLDFMMRSNNKFFNRRFLKIVACDADTNMDSSRRRRRRA
ncbi:transcription initiation factor TFIIA small subunit [Pancytospora philotis]|nr:transcription initiation factor TFIIA small subunit [Pancytospora philotis]KAI4291095.1 transcription initiation factor TFIIA small subunit [Pancytospora philotis]